MNDYTTRTSCRVCGYTDLTPIFSLGEQYVSDFVDRNKVCSGNKVPIDLELCNVCSLVQQKHTAPNDLLYSRHYWYRSGVTQTMREALRDVTRSAEAIVDLQPDDIVLDIGSNDGTLLRSYERQCVRFGFEPATNLYEEGKQGLTLLCRDFWSADRYFEMLEGCDEELHGLKAKIITACGMLYDLEDPNQFIADVAKVLHPEGIFIAQLMCLRNMLALGDVGNLAHEHLEFYSIKSMQYLLNKHGLAIQRIERNRVNGESYRFYIRHKDWIRQLTHDLGRDTQTIHAAKVNEAGYSDPNQLKKIFAEWDKNRRTCQAFITSAVNSGKKVWVYGASTKGNVILQWYGFDTRLINGAADRSPEKWGKYTVGTGIPIKSEEEARKALPDYFLVLPYAFLLEFIEREENREWRTRGGKFLVPLPQFRIL